MFKCIFANSTMKVNKESATISEPGSEISYIVASWVELHSHRIWHQLGQYWSDPSLIGLQERSSNVLHFDTSLNYILWLQYTVKLKQHQHFGLIATAWIWSSTDIISHGPSPYWTNSTWGQTEGDVLSGAATRRALPVFNSPEWTCITRTTTEVQRRNKAMFSWFYYKRQQQVKQCLWDLRAGLFPDFISRYENPVRWETSGIYSWGHWWPRWPEHLEAGLRLTPR